MGAAAIPIVTAGAGIFGAKKSADAAKDASRRQIAAQQQAQAQTQQLSQPFVNIGTDTAPAFQSFLDPQNQYEFLQNNPLYQASLNRLDRDTLGAAANNGRLGAGDTSSQLAENVMLAASPLIGQRFNQLAQGVSFGQAAAAGQAANVMNTQSNIGNSAAAGIVGRQNAINNGINNVVSTLPMFQSAFQKQPTNPMMGTINMGSAFAGHA